MKLNKTAWSKEITRDGYHVRAGQLLTGDGYVFLVHGIYGGYVYGRLCATRRGTPYPLNLQRLTTEPTP